MQTRQLQISEIDKLIYKTPLIFIRSAQLKTDEKNRRLTRYTITEGPIIAECEKVVQKALGEMNRQKAIS